MIGGADGLLSGQRLRGQIGGKSLALSQIGRTDSGTRRRPRQATAMKNSASSVRRKSKSLPLTKASARGASVLNWSVGSADPAESTDLGAAY